MIQLRVLLQCIETSASLGRFACDIVMQLLQGGPDDFGLMDEKVSQVTLIRFGLQKSRAVLHRRFPQELGDRDKFKQPVTRMKHLPVKERPGGSPIAIHEGMVVGEPEVQNDSANHRL